MTKKHKRLAFTLNLANTDSIFCLNSKLRTCDKVKGYIISANKTFSNTASSLAKVYPKS